MSVLLRSALLAAFTFAASSTPVKAAPESYRVQYSASLYGMLVGRAVLESRFEGEGFAIAGRFSSAGIARLFDRTDGIVTVNGWLGEDGSQPNSYALSYRSGDEHKKTTISFDRGRVTATENEPEEKNGGKQWVPVKREHLTSVSDPLSALMLPASSEQQVCNRTIEVYDGEIRVDLVLQPASAGEVFRGSSVTCRARFVPVSGYRKNRSSIAFLRDRSRILIGFQRVEERNLYSPSHASIATKVGTVHIRAHNG